ncbi:hypothetical protein B0H15DRAFT_580048 [Mycena belliarum]|uniref:Uncharacterized protein n=1 Tax=Mycena belliarum TaxID=1033014 RepID=A0AAD6UGL0_9AGAR|nr:hypothetical protein B0H15DRAFT_580048 [Mycena belliae]
MCCICQPETFLLLSVILSELSNFDPTLAWNIHLALLLSPEFSFLQSAHSKNSPSAATHLQKIQGASAPGIVRFDVTWGGVFKFGPHLSTVINIKAI